MASALGALVVLLLLLQNTILLRILTPAAQVFVLAWTLLLSPLLLKLLKKEIPEYAHVNPYSLNSVTGWLFPENMRPGRDCVEVMIMPWRKESELVLDAELGIHGGSMNGWEPPSPKFFCTFNRARNLCEAVCVCVCVCVLGRVSSSTINLTAYLTSPFGYLTCLNLNSLNMLPWRRQWHPTPVLLPGKSHGWRRLVDCSPLGR